MASSSSMKKQLESITQCPVCMETYKDPRSLPCVHTFCLECVEGFSRDKLPGDDVACPMCRKEFVIPENGVKGLPKNFFIEQFKDVKELSANTEIAESTVASCEKHPGESLRRYCFDCKSTICEMCFVGLHKSHECSDVSEVADDFRRQMTTDCSNMTDCVKRCSKLLKQVLNKKDTYAKQISNVESEINKQAEQLKQLIDQHRDKLQLEVASSRSSRMKQVDSVVAGIEEHMSFASCLIKYSDELRDKGAASEIARQSSSLHDRAGELLKLDVIQRAVNELGSVDVKFTAAKTSDNLMLGYIQAKHATIIFDESATPTLSLTHVIPAGDLVAGVTSLNNELFVVRNPCKEQIEVYDTETFTFQGAIRVDGLRDSHYRQCRLASCATNNCLYITDYYKNAVCRVKLAVNNNIFKWRVGSGPTGISVSNACNVLVTCFYPNRIREYTTHGSLVREICLQSDVTCPRHAVQLSSGQFAVSHSAPVYGVSIVDSEGRVVASYRNKPESKTQRLHRPAQLAVSNSDCILVADSGNNRIVLLSPSLDKSLPVSVDGGLNRPWVVYFDESRGRLYVGEFSSGRVLVFDDVFNIETLI